ncbi:MAG: sialidase family protein [Planctomycetia bacterium]|nr:sialidase family protein [Planctomycetia bacterium]
MITSFVRRCFVLDCAIALITLCSVFCSPKIVCAQNYGSRNAILEEELIFQTAPFPSCHASTIVQSAHGTLIAAWFGGYYESHSRVGIWFSRKVNGRWTPPVEAANGLQSDGTYLSCWNPVLFQPKNGPLLLFFKVGPTPQTWRGEMMISHDDGKTWEDRRKLGDDLIGPVRCKPIEMADGRLVCPSSNEADNIWRTHLETTSDLGKTWTKTDPLHSKEEAQTIQPTLFSIKEKDGKVIWSILCRNKNGNGKIWQSWSKDGAKTFSKFEETILPNPNSGIDTVSLQDGRVLIIYNHTNLKSPDPQKPLSRSMINLAVSSDGKSWEAACIFENSPKAEFSYPAMIQTADGLVHITYTWKRTHIKHIVLDPAMIKGIPMPKGDWPK